MKQSRSITLQKFYGTLERNGEIIARFRKGESQADLAREYGRSSQRINQIVRRLEAQQTLQDRILRAFRAFREDLYSRLGFIKNFQ